MKPGNRVAPFRLKDLRQMSFNVAVWVIVACVIVNVFAIHGHEIAVAAVSLLPPLSY